MPAQASQVHPAPGIPPWTRRPYATTTGVHQVVVPQPSLDALRREEQRGPLTITDLISETLAERVQQSTQETSISSEAYERLIAGERVSWSQILREHPLLGKITVAQLVNAGVVRVMPDHNPTTGQTDFLLSMANATPQNGGASPAR
jgi:hypothetical protein